MGLLAVGVVGVSDSFVFRDPFSFSWIASPNLDMKIRTESHCNLICHVWLISCKARWLLKADGGAVVRRWEVGERGRGRSGGRGNCHRDVMYERRINKTKELEILSRSPFLLINLSQLL